MSLRARHDWAVKVLHAAGIDSALCDARLILAHVHNVDAGRIGTMLNDNDGWNAAQQKAFCNAVVDRADGRSVAKIIGRKAFWKTEFLVNDHVLDPRPDTETLVGQALMLPFSRVLDLGTGSGCILLSLLEERPGATGLGVDISAQALKVARKNAQALGTARAEFALSDWFTDVTGHFDLIISNPPYISAQEMAGLPVQAIGNDPALALTDGADGLSAYYAITAGAMHILISGGYLAVEIGYQQGATVAHIFVKAGFTEVQITTDINKRDRVVQGKKP